MTLGIERHFRFIPPAINAQFEKIRDLCGYTRAKHRHRLFRIFRAALRTVDQLPARSICKLRLDGDAIGERQATAGWPRCLRKNTSGLAEQEAEEIQKVANFAH